jgi:hypothetical protein
LGRRHEILSAERLAKNFEVRADRAIANVPYNRLSGFEILNPIEFRSEHCSHLRNAAAELLERQLRLTPYVDDPLNRYGSDRIG